MKIDITAYLPLTINYRQLSAINLIGNFDKQ